jgi:hypothetical protein
MSGKQIYALFHHSMPTDPVSFVSISLLDALPKSMEVYSVCGNKRMSWGLGSYGKKESIVERR